MKLDKRCRVQNGQMAFYYDVALSSPGSIRAYIFNLQLCLCFAGTSNLAVCPSNSPYGGKLLLVRKELSKIIKEIWKCLQSPYSNVQFLVRAKYRQSAVIWVGVPCIAIKFRSKSWSDNTSRALGNPEKHFLSFFIRCLVKTCRPLSLGSNLLIKWSIRVVLCLQVKLQDFRHLESLDSGHEFFNLVSHVVEKLSLEKLQLCWVNQTLRLWHSCSQPALTI